MEIASLVPPPSPDHIDIQIGLRCTGTLLSLRQLELEELMNLRAIRFYRLTHRKYLLAKGRFQTYQFSNFLKRFYEQAERP